MALFWLALSWLGGVAAGPVVKQPPWAWLALAGLGAGAAWVYRAEGRLRLALICATLFGLGGLRYQLALPSYDDRFVSTYNDAGEVALEGVVVDEPDVRDTYINLRLRTDLLLLPGANRAIPVDGLVLVRAARFPEFGYGDRLRASGALETPPEFEDFSYAGYLARQGVYSVLRDPQITLVAHGQGNPVLQRVYGFKARALQTLEQIFPQPAAALMQGILLGVESGIPADLKEAFSVTGTSHIVAISGFNITLIAGVFARVARRLVGRRRAWLPALAGIAGYTFLVGADAAVVRAAIMGGLALLVRSAGRAADGLNALLAAALLMTLANPLTLWDVGFQLSFAATLGLILYADPLSQAFIRLWERFTTPERARRAAGLASDAFLLTLAAQLTTLPLMAYYFRRISPVSLLANLFILPAQPAVMMVSGVALLAGLLWLPAGQALGWLAFPFVAYTLGLVDWFARFPGAVLYLGGGSGAFLAAGYGLLFGLTWAGRRSGPGMRLPAWAASAGLAGAAALAFLAWHGHFRAPDGRLRLTVLDVGQSEAVLIESPVGRRMLIGGGPSASALSSALGQSMPLWDRRLDWAVIAAPGDEHLAGLAGLPGPVRVGAVLAAGTPGRGAGTRALMETLSGMGIPVQQAESGQAFDLGQGATLEVISAGKAGAVLRLAWDRAAFLLPIGLDGPTLEALLEHGRLGPAHGLLLAGGGDVALNSEELLAAVNPALCVAPVGAATTLPSSLLHRLEGRTLLRTDRSGWIEWATDGRQVWVRTEK